MGPVPVFMSLEETVEDSSFAQIEQLDNPAVVEIVHLTGYRMACVSKFWREAVARAQGERLYKLSRVQEIRDRFPILTTLSIKSLPYEVFYVSKKIHEEVLKLLQRLPDDKRSYYQSFSPVAITNSHELFLQLVKDVPPSAIFIKRIFFAAVNGMKQRIENMDFSVLEEDGSLPYPC